MKKKVRALKPMSPHQARTLKDICTLKRDNISGRKSWILLDGTNVVICQQEPGEEAKGTVHLTRSDFVKLTAWYFRPQTRRSRPNGRAE
jgi:hypothetical protein